jgi:hypothetical protein
VARTKRPLCQRYRLLAQLDRLVDAGNTVIMERSARVERHGILRHSYRKYLLKNEFKRTRPFLCLRYTWDIFFIRVMTQHAWFKHR